MSNEDWGETRLDGNDGNYPKSFKIQGGKSVDEEVSNFFRIFPAMKEQKNTGKIAHYHRTHYGYKVPNPRNDKGMARPFVCIEEKDFSTQMIKQNCPECDQIKQKTTELAALKTSIENAQNQRMDEAKAKKATAVQLSKLASQFSVELETQTAPLKEWLKAHNCERKWRLNVKNKANEVGSLAVSNNLWKSIKSELKKLGEKWKVDPLHPEKGVWVNIIRTGNGSGIPPASSKQDKVEFEEEAIDPSNPMSGSKIKLAPLTQQDADRVKKGCRDVADPAPAMVLDKEIIEMLVNCDESFEEVERILGLRQTAEPVADESNVVEEEELPVIVKPVVKATKPAVKPAPVIHAAPEPVVTDTVEGGTTSEDDEEAALRAQLAAMEEKRKAKAAAAKVASKPVAPVAPPVTVVEDLDDDEFLNAFSTPKPSGEKK